MLIDDDNVSYVKDDDEYFFEKRMKVPKTAFVAEEGKKLSKEEQKLSNKLNHETDTKNYTRFDEALITPEIAEQEERVRQNKVQTELVKEYANPVFAQAVRQVEDKLHRKINYDEFDKMCKTYAAELANADARTRKTDPNPVDYQTYYDQLIQNKKVVPLYKIYAQRLEQSKVDEIGSLLDQAKADINGSHLVLKAGSSVNVHHKGKVTFEDDEKRRRITIDNKRDVELLHMKLRKEYIDKKYPKEISEELGEVANGPHTNDGFE
jgi:hypothetical protein